MAKELYLRELKRCRKHLRKNMTGAERYLWLFLRKQRSGYKFRRQVSIGHFIVDFYCKDIALAIEVDGSIHDRKAIKERDRKRQEIIEADGVYFLRFKNEDVFYNTLDVLRIIKKTCRLLRTAAPPCGELSASG